MKKFWKVGKITKETKSFRLGKEDEEALEEVIKIFGLEGRNGERSKAVRKALHYTAQNWGRAWRRFKAEFGSEEQDLIKKKLGE